MLLNFGQQPRWCKSRCFIFGNWKLTSQKEKWRWPINHLKRVFAKFQIVLMKVAPNEITPQKGICVIVHIVVMEGMLDTIFPCQEITTADIRTLKAGFARVLHTDSLSWSKDNGAFRLRFRKGNWPCREHLPWQWDRHPCQQYHPKEENTKSGDPCTIHFPREFSSSAPHPQAWRLRVQECEM